MYLIKALCFSRPMISYLKTNLPTSRKSSIDSKTTKPTVDENPTNKTIETQLIEVVHTFVILLCVSIVILSKIRLL